MTVAAKIKNVYELVEITKKLREDGKKIVHCHGVFDLLHIGHIRYFRQARKFGDVLVVTLTPDCFVDKGPGRPAFHEELRVEAIASLAEVDYVALNNWETAVELLRVLRPNYYVKGSEFKGIQSDYTGKIGLELEVVDEIGAEMVFTEDIVFSSSNLINRFLSERPKETQEYLNFFTKRYSIENVHDTLEQLSSIKVLVIGDTILDDYQYCEPIGKSNKDPILTLHYKSNDVFSGGGLAVANQIANFADKVDLITVLGEADPQEELIRKNLHSNVSPYFLMKPDAPTTMKRRYIDNYSFNKLLEVNIMNNSGLPEKKVEELCELLKNQLPKYDLVVVADFGYDVISDRVIQVLCEGAKYLAINTQTSAANRGFHSISQYPKADFVCLGEQDFRMETREKASDLRNAMKALAEKMKCSSLVITRGQRGCEVRKQNGDFVAIPAFATSVVDRVGVGEVFFAISSLIAVCECDDELIGFIGNIFGGLAVGIIGNEKDIDKMSVKKYITALLK